MSASYIVLASELHSIGPRGEARLPPLTLVGDFGGGAPSCVGAAILESQESGKGQVVDVAIG
jgi:alpha-methylacyl-CoA racemase